MPAEPLVSQSCVRKCSSSACACPGSTWEGTGTGRSLPWQVEGAGPQKGAEPGAGVSSELCMAQLLSLLALTLLRSRIGCGNSRLLRVFPINSPEEKRAVNAFIPLPEPAEDVCVAPNPFAVRAGLWRQPQTPFPSSQIAARVTTSLPNRCSCHDIPLSPWPGTNHTHSAPGPLPGHGDTSAVLSPVTRIFPG